MPPWSPRQALRLLLLESQRKTSVTWSLRTRRPCFPHPKAVAPTPQQPPLQVPRLPARPCQPTTAAALRPAHSSARSRPRSAPRVSPCISASAPHQWAFTLPRLFPPPPQPFIFARPSLNIQYQTPAQPLLPSHASPPPRPGSILPMTSHFCLPLPSPCLFLPGSLAMPSQPCLQALFSKLPFLQTLFKPAG